MTVGWIELDRGRRDFEPGDTVRGEVGWEAVAPSGVELRLFWYTEGKGTRDVGVVDSLALGASPQGRLPFAFELPAGPCSFSGRLISIVWALELVVAGGSAAREVVVVGPGGREIVVSASPSADATGTEW